MPIASPQTTFNRADVTNVGTTLGQSLSATAGTVVNEGPFWASLNAMDVYFSDDEEGEIYGQDEANERAREQELDLSFDAPVNKKAFDLLTEMKQDENYRKQVMARAPTGLLPGAARLGVGLLTSFGDPINIASAFVPVARIKDFNTIMSATKTAGGRAMLRARTGVREGVVGAALTEPLSYGSLQYTQADYDMTDASMNVAFGAIFGATAHAGLGAYTDFATNKALKQAEAVETFRSGLESVSADIKLKTNTKLKDYGNAVKAQEGLTAPQVREQFFNATPETREAAFKLALTQALTGRKIDASPILNADEKAVLGPIQSMRSEVKSYLADNLEGIISDLDVQVKSEYLSKTDMKRVKSQVKTLKKEIEGLAERESWVGFKEQARKELPRGTAKKKVTAHARELQKGVEAQIELRINDLDATLGKGKEAKTLRSKLDQIKGKLKTNRSAAIDELADLKHLEDSLRQTVVENKVKSDEFLLSEAESPSVNMADKNISDAVEVELKSTPSEDMAMIDAELEAVNEIYAERYPGEEPDAEMVAAEEAEVSAQKENDAAFALANCMMRGGA